MPLRFVFGAFFAVCTPTISGATDSEPHMPAQLIMATSLQLGRMRSISANLLTAASSAGPNSAEFGPSRPTCSRIRATISRWQQDLVKTRLNLGRLRTNVARSQPSSAGFDDSGRVPPIPRWPTLARAETLRGVFGPNRPNSADSGPHADLFVLARLAPILGRLGPKLARFAPPPDPPRLDRKWVKDPTDQRPK